MESSKQQIGAYITEDGQVQLTVWAPLATHVAVVPEGSEERRELQKDEQGYWTIRTDRLKPGSRFKIAIDDQEPFPDPASRAQPEGVHGPSEVVDLKAFAWTDQNWQTPPMENYIITELHTGTFSEEGTFAGIEAKLDYLLKDLGINAIEIMPVAQFPGTRNWGYDGVFPFAVQHNYGGPRGLQQLVNACHEKGIAVILDVVYNHLGPEGNYLGAFGPYFTEKYKTPWGNALNFDDAWCDGVRHYFIQNALQWFRDFHIDALRLDAVHAIRDFSPVHILREIKQEVDDLVKESGRRHFLIVELDLNDTRYINPLEKEGYGMDAQWIDEFHHALRVTATGDRQGYYSDFADIEHLAKSYKDAYVYDGQFSPHRKKSFGIKSDNPGRQFIVFSQNHDQVGNRMLGERTSQLVSFHMQKLLAAAVFVSPYIPMLFMGEEWSEPNPFQYFVSHTDPELAEAVRKGRREEFAAFHIEGEAPDPMAEETFLQSKLSWPLREQEPHRTMLAYYKELIRLRRSNKVLRSLNRQHLHVECNKDHQTLLLYRWEEEENLVCLMNFSQKERAFPAPSYAGDWYLLLDSADPRWKGQGQPKEHVAGGGRPGTSTIILQPESICIYSSRPPAV
jgi:maltooligosyltrehalose trehalohydrolase